MSKRFKFGWDLDETITPAPELMAALINSLYDAGHEVHIITYRHPLYHKEETIRELEDYGIKYHYLHLTGQKDELCDIWKIDMALDDSADHHYPDRDKFWVGIVLPKIKIGVNDSGLNFHKARKKLYACDVQTETIEGKKKELEPSPVTEEELQELKKYDTEL